MDVSRIDPGCIFKKKTKRLNWSKIDDANLESVQQNLNVNVLQNNLTNLTYCDLQSEMNNIAFSDEKEKKKLTKAFMLTQLIIEYLMFCQNQCEKRLEHLEEELKGKNNIILSMAQVIAEKDAQIEKFKKIERLSINEGLPLKQNCGPVLKQILDEVQNIKVLNANLFEAVSHLKAENRNVPIKMEEMMEAAVEACNSSINTRRDNLAAFVSTDDDLSISSNNIENLAKTLENKDFMLKDIVGQLSSAFCNVPKLFGPLKLSHIEMETSDQLLNENPNIDPDSSSSMKEFYPDSNAFRVNRSCSMRAGSSSSSSAESFIALENREPSDFSLTPVEDKPAVD